MNGAVERWRSRVGIGWGSRIFGEGAEEEDATGTGTGFGFREARGVTVDMENHPAGGVADRGIWMDGTVVEELGDGLSSGFSAFRLGRRKGSKGNKHGGVDGASIVEDGANDFLESSEARGIKEGSSVGRLGELSGCAIGRSGPGMWRVLGTAGWLMLEFEESFFNVARHGHVDSACCVIPLEGHAKEAFARPFCGDVI